MEDSAEGARPKRVSKTSSGFDVFNHPATKTGRVVKLHRVQPMTVGSVHANRRPGGLVPNFIRVPNTTSRK